MSRNLNFFKKIKFQMPSEDFLLWSIYHEQMHKIFLTIYKNIFLSILKNWENENFRLFSNKIFNITIHVAFPGFVKIKHQTLPCTCTIDMGHSLFFNTFEHISKFIHNILKTEQTKNEKLLKFLECDYSHHFIVQNVKKRYEKISVKIRKLAF